MSAGLFGLLDDVSTLAQLASASGRATAKAAGVVIDDTAVTPQYLRGIAAERELPIIRRIAVGSLRNKLLLILPTSMLLSQFAPRLLTPILMLGAAYLCYEGAERLWGSLGGHQARAVPVAEDDVVTGAVRTDLVLSAEIMLIALSVVARHAFISRLVSLVIVALVLTAAVYGVVALIVRMDDVGLRLTESPSGIGRTIGRGLVAGMPKLLSAISIIGVTAMLWVGGHILRAGVGDLGWHAPGDVVHHVGDQVRHAVDFAGGVLEWLLDSSVSALVGLAVGSLVLAFMHLLSFTKRRRTSV